MEKRNLQRTGGTSFTVTVPKQWVEASGLKDKESVYMSELPTGELVISSSAIAKKSIRMHIALAKYSNGQLARELIARYLSGADEIVLEGTKISPEQRNKVRAIIQTLIGLEIIDESSSSIHVRNIFDIKKFPVRQNIEKMFLMAESMFSDAVASVKRNDIPLARDVINRDTEVDKLYFAMTRQYHSVIAKKLHEADIGMETSIFVYYAYVAAQVERVADHAVKIAKMTIAKHVMKLPEILLHESAMMLLSKLKDAQRMVFDLDTKAAHGILDGYNEWEHRFMQHNRTFPDMILFLDSLDRIYRYILNIAEVTIDQSVMNDGTKV